MSATTTDRDDEGIRHERIAVTRGPDSRNPLTAKPADQKRYRPRLFSRPKRSRAIRAGLVGGAMVEALRANGPILLILLNTLVVGLVFGGILCATLICR